MTMRNTPFALITSVGLLATLAGCAQSSVTTEHDLYRGSEGHVYSWNGAGYEFEGMTAGEGSLLRIHRAERPAGAVHDAYVYEVVFQLPPEVEVGTTYSFAAVSSARLPQAHPRKGMMQAGEMSVYQIRQPAMTQLALDGHGAATLTIRSMDEGTATIDVEVAATLTHAAGEFVLDDTFTVTVHDQPAASVRSAHAMTMERASLSRRDDGPRSGQSRGTQP